MFESNQVAPGELEGYLASHPLVHEAAVCAAWDNVQETEIPVAYVVLTEDGRHAHSIHSTETTADIRHFVDEKVSPYKRLRGGVFVLDELPKTGTGKVLRRELPARKARLREAKL